MDRNLVNNLRDAYDMRTKDAEIAVESVVEGIKRTLDTAGVVRMPGFGTFRRVDQAERAGRNPATGAAITIPARQKTVFKPSK